MKMTVLLFLCFALGVGVSWFVLGQSGSSESSGPKSQNIAGGIDRVQAEVAALREDLSLVGKEQADVGSLHDELRAIKKKMAEIERSLSALPTPQTASVGEKKAQEAETPSSEELAQVNDLVARLQARSDDVPQTLPDLFASQEMRSLSPAARERLVQDVVRMLNSGELNPDEFLPHRP